MSECRKGNLTHFAVTIISKDRPGIVADVTEVLFRLGCNIEDSSCTMLGGDFAMILIVSHDKPFPRSGLDDEFKGLHERTGLTASVRHLTENEVCSGERGGGALPDFGVRFGPAGDRVPGHTGACRPRCQHHRPQYQADRNARRSRSMS